MAYNFYNWNKVSLKFNVPEYPNLHDVCDLYDALDKVWCRYTCAPRMRDDYSKENKTLGQCSVTSFAVQDIIGGEVYGIPLPDGSYHCFNVKDGQMFDLTSEQFGDEKLNYTLDHPQSREVHFASQEKYQRYLYLKKELVNKLR